MASALSQVLRFVSAGGIGVLLYYIVLYTLTDLAGIWYMTSAIIASVVNYGSNFLLHKTWTFGNENLHNVHQQMGHYLLMVVVLFGMNTGLLYVLVEYAHLWYLAAQAIITVVITAISFFVSRRIFAD